MEFSFMIGNSIFKLLKTIKDMLGENLFILTSINTKKN